MTEPGPGQPDEPDRAYDPDDHPHPLRSEDVEALIGKKIG